MLTMSTRGRSGRLARQETDRVPEEIRADAQETRDRESGGLTGESRPRVMTTVLTWIGVWCAGALVVGLVLGLGLRRLAQRDPGESEFEQRPPSASHRSQTSPAAIHCRHNPAGECDTCAGRPEQGTR
ncbi:hypothetical protein GCM10010472_34260 [Pseudonocardia halophobica]|uniref:Uncharacterized protein n=1 Tax=Pseudonocardia halophobica TaxID=29401 RepID=A0A9W6L4Q7_9PSEU|nr:hypothetical protein GCM10017577_32060 [Pseudonocardia halophobica]